jgi:hypothetical protein
MNKLWSVLACVAVFGGAAIACGGSPEGSVEQKTGEPSPAAKAGEEGVEITSSTAGCCSCPTYPARCKDPNHP